MRPSELAFVMDYERYLLEDLPKDNKVIKAFEDAVNNNVTVSLLVKGFRPMYARAHSTRSFNEFRLPGYQENYGAVPVPTVCVLAKIDPRLAQDAYFLYRNHERWPHLRPELDEEIGLAQMQLVTNLFPFVAIDWYRECADKSECYAYHIALLERKGPFLAPEEIRRQCDPARAIQKSYNRHLMKEISRRRHR